MVQLGYPSDEVGNHLVDIDALDDSGIDPYKDVLSVAEFRRHFGTPLHPFTGVDYISYYTQLIEEEGAEAEIILANRPEAILAYADKVLCCDTHTRFSAAYWRQARTCVSPSAIYSTHLSTAADTTKNTAFSVPTKPPRA